MLRTREEYDEYMQLAEEAGWKWYGDDGIRRTFSDYGDKTHIEVEDGFCASMAPMKCETAITLPELKAKFGIGTKTKLEQWHHNESYTKSGHTLYPDKIKLASGKEYTPAELQAELNLLRSISKAHKKFFPSSR